MDKTPICKRCGLCCYLIIDNKPSNKKCRNLVLLKSGTTVCRIYGNRIGTNIGRGNLCVNRKDSPFDYEGCPFNLGNKPIVKLKSDGTHYLEEIDAKEDL